MSKARQFFESSMSIAATTSSCSKTSSLAAENRFFVALKNEYLSHPRCKQYEGYPNQQRPRIFGGERLLGSSSLRSFCSGAGSKAKNGSFSRPLSIPNTTAASAASPTVSCIKELPMTMEALWKESTARILDDKQTPVGSMTSLQWHLAETLVLYWSSSRTLPPKMAQIDSPKRNQSNKNYYENSNDAVDYFEATKKGNGLALKILDRLAQEKIAVTGNHNSGGKDDFRIVDVSLIHAVLKQWKECLQWVNQKNNTRKHSSTPSQNRQNNQQQFEQKMSGLFLPSKLLDKLESWISLATKDETGSKQAFLFEPNIATYTILMDGASSCRNYRERVTFTEDLLEWLLNESSNTFGDCTSKLRPTVVTIGTVINALANSRTNKSAERAEKWLRKIPDLFCTDPIRPNTVIYTTVIRAWADVGRADKAEDLLREMCNDYVGSDGGTGNPDAKPSLWTFNTVLAAWSRSKNPSSVIQAEGLIRTMISLSSTRTADEADEKPGISRQTEMHSNRSNSVLKLDVSPSIVSYNSLMSTIASRSRQPDSLTRAEYWMEEILNAAATKPWNHRRRQNMGRQNDDSISPNFITYRALFNIISAAGNLSNAEKADRMRYWLARGSSPSLPPSNFGNNASKLADNRYLLSQIEAMEAESNKQT